MAAPMPLGRVCSAFTTNSADRGISGAEPRPVILMVHLDHRGGAYPKGT
jgi:hypothetical protein